MGRFEQGVLSDMDCISVWLLSQTKDGKTDEVEFAKLLDQRRGQVREEVIQLSKDLEILELSDKISSKDFYRQAAIYLLSNQENISMTQASELFVRLEQERESKPLGDYAKIVESMKTPSYSDVENSKKVEKLDDDGTVEWVHAGTVKLEQLKKKYQRR